MRARATATVLAVGIAATAATVLTPLPAMAAGGSVVCLTTGYANPGHTLLTYECDLSATYATGELWSGIQVDAASQGTDTATGTCKTVPQAYAYYPQVKYYSDPAGGITTTSSRAFLCGVQFCAVDRSARRLAPLVWPSGQPGPLVNWSSVALAEVAVGCGVRGIRVHEHRVGAAGRRDLDVIRQ